MTKAQILASLASETKDRSHALDVARDLLLETMPDAHPRSAEWILKTGPRFVGVEFFSGFVAVYSRGEYGGDYIYAQVYKTQKNTSKPFATRSAKTVKELQKDVEGVITEQTTGESLEVGDVFVYTLSYNMTTNKFYEVVSVRGSKAVLSPCASVLGEMSDGWHGTETCGARDVTQVFTVHVRKGVPYINGKKLSKTSRNESHFFNHLD